MSRVITSIQMAGDILRTVTFVGTATPLSDPELNEPAILPPLIDGFLEGEADHTLSSESSKRALRRWRVPDPRKPARR